MKTRTKIIITAILAITIVSGAFVVKGIKEQVDLRANAQDTATEYVGEDVNETENKETTEGLQTKTKKDAEKVIEEKKNEIKTSNKTESKTETKIEKSNTTEALNEQKPKTETVTEGRKNTTEAPATTTGRKTDTTPTKPANHEHSWKWVVDKAAYDEDVYEDRPIYEDRPVYEERPIYEERPVYEDTYEVWEVYIFDTGAKFYTYCFTTETIGDFYQMDAYAETTYGSYNAGMCHCSIRDEKIKTGTKQTGTEKVQTGTEKVQTGTEKVQTGTERVKTGTVHHDEVGHYECSCGEIK